MYPALFDIDLVGLGTIASIPVGLVPVDLNLVDLTPVSLVSIVLGPQFELGLGTLKLENWGLVFLL